MKKNFKRYVKYLKDYYLSENAPFYFGHFNYYDSVIKRRNFNVSTNGLESINKRLKKANGAGALPLKNAFRVFKEFIEDLIANHEGAMVNNKMNRRRSNVVEGEKALSEIMEGFLNLTPEEQKESVIETAFEIEKLGKMKLNENNLEQSLTLEESFTGK